MNHDNMQYGLRIAAMKQKLIEMAQGNLNTYLNIGANEDELEGIAMLLNMVTENWAQRVKHAAMGTSVLHEQYFQLFHLQLDYDLKIIDLSDLSLSLLNIPSSKILNKPISSIICPQSNKRLIQTTLLVKNRSSYEQTTLLKFTHHPLSMVYQAQVQHNSLSLTYSLQLMALRHAEFKQNFNTLNKSQMKQKAYIEGQIQKVHSFLCNPKNYKKVNQEYLCKEFGLNAYTLKTKFKEIYHDSFYNFHLRIRISNSKLLVMTTKLPLKKIAHICGFNCYPSFHRAFKKQYHITPKDLRTTRSRLALESKSL